MYFVNTIFCCKYCHLVDFPFKRILISSNLTWSLFSAAQPSPHPTTPSWHKFSDLNWDYTKFSRQAWPSVKVNIRLKVIVMDQIEVNVKIMADVKVQVQLKFKDRVIVKIKVMVQIKATAKVKVNAMVKIKA